MEGCLLRNGPYKNGFIYERSGSKPDQEIVDQIVSDLEGTWNLPHGLSSVLLLIKGVVLEQKKA
ncbi:hypothetical protein [Jeotgalibacillus soli]|uniref:Uncharacterized protein n=1 Tax=Jeotgalibacillus soli TaxID=889306 RepID=A0A0C2S5I0_9BACL|nr:hypothetical protein [Jeotgalibacillus soli]KIL49294.1 hypothetical protein KP78_07620 [Jeotgalibacillus soli]